MTRALVDAAGLLVLGVAAGSAGWWAHATVDEWRTRRMLARLHQRLDVSEVVAHH